MSKYHEIHAFQPETWREYSACKPYPTEWWYPADGGNGLDQRKARVICSNCEVREDCLMSSLRRREEGIWGGLNIKERRKFARELDIKKVLVCHHCRCSYEKPANRAQVSMYCSTRCRKAEDIRRQVHHNRATREAS